MKKALFLTNGSPDLARSLNHWLTTQTESVDLTVVYPFALSPPDIQPLTAVTYRTARQTAHDELTHWLRALPQSSLPEGACIQAETLAGQSEQVLMLYLLLRRYDYLLMGTDQQDVMTTFLRCQSQIATQLRSLPGDSFGQS